MPEETQAVSSPAELVDPFNGEQPSLDEFNQYRQSGELPARFKPADKADSTPADAPEETETAESESSEPAPDSEPEEKQELPKATPAEKRIKQLLEKIKELERKPAEKQDVKPESSPAPAEPTTRPKPTADDKKPDGTPKYSTYEDFVEELADWKAEQRWEVVKREQQQMESKKAFDSQMSEVRARYDDADAVISPTIKTLNEAKLPRAVHEAVGTSPQFFDLCYELGSDPEKLEKFISLAQTNPRAAIKQVFADEDRVGTRESVARDEKGKFVAKEAPEVKKTSAPKPPSPVGGASSRAFDVSDESLSAEDWARKRTADLQKRRG